jgi:hypothetical protein
MFPFFTAATIGGTGAPLFFPNSFDNIFMAHPLSENQYPGIPGRKPL